MFRLLDRPSIDACCSLLPLRCSQTGIAHLLNSSDSRREEESAPVLERDDDPAPAVVHGDDASRRYPT